MAFGVGAIILIGGTSTAATVAMAFGSYLRAFVNLPRALRLFCLLAGCTALNIWGLRESSWVNILFGLYISVSFAVLMLASPAELAASEAPLPEHHGSRYCI